MSKVVGSLLQLTVGSRGKTNGRSAAPLRSKSGGRTEAEPHGMWAFNSTAPCRVESARKRAARSTRFRHTVERYLAEYLEGAGLNGKFKLPFFQSTKPRPFG